MACARGSRCRAARARSPPRWEPLSAWAAEEASLRLPLTLLLIRARLARPSGMHALPPAPRLSCSSWQDETRLVVACLLKGGEPQQETGKSAERFFNGAMQSTIDQFRQAQTAGMQHALCGCSRCRPAHAYNPQHTACTCCTPANARPFPPPHTYCAGRRRRCLWGRGACARARRRLAPSRCPSRACA